MMLKLCKITLQRRNEKERLWGKRSKSTPGLKTHQNQPSPEYENLPILGLPQAQNPTNPYPRNPHPGKHCPSKPYKSQSSLSPLLLLTQTEAVILLSLSQ